MLAIEEFNLLVNVLRYQHAPFVATRNALPYFGRRAALKLFIKIEGADRVRMLGFIRKRPTPRVYPKLRHRKEPIQCVIAVVGPRQDPLCGVTSADQGDLRPAVSLHSFSRDLQKEPSR